MYDISIRGENCIERRQDIADAMVVNGNLRYVTVEKESHSVENGALLKAVSQKDMKIGVKMLATGKTKTFTNARFAKIDTEESLVYVSGPGFLERVVGEIVRIKRVHLP